MTSQNSFDVYVNSPCQNARYGSRCRSCRRRRFEATSALNRKRAADSSLSNRKGFSTLCPCEETHFQDQELGLSGVMVKGRGSGCWPRGTYLPPCRCNRSITRFTKGEFEMSGLIYLVGLVVVVIAVLSFFGMH
jgi:hypothetical protein